MSDVDRERWDARYGSRDDPPGSPHPFLDRVAAGHLPPSGRALDVAGGTGRHARWLARRGLTVTLCDISPAALARARRAADAEGWALRTVEADLDAELPSGPWDVVLVSYFLVVHLERQLVDGLAPGGVLVVVHPTLRNLERHHKPGARWLLEDGAWPEGLAGLQLLHREEGWGEEDRHELRLVARKAGQS